MDFLEWANDRPLPKALQSRSGWAALFEHHRAQFPHIHQIEPTNQCNLSCMMCPRKDNMTRKVGLMEIALFHKIIDEIANFPEKVKEKELELFHFGESLFHPHFPEMIRYASAQELKPVLSINPMNLSQEHIEILPQCMPHKIIVSLDSMEAKKLQRIRGPKADLTKSVTNTELLLQSNLRQGNITDIVIRMIVMDINRDEIESFKKFWAQRGGRVEFRDFFPWNKEELSGLGTFKKYPPFMPCPFPWQYMVIQWNGDIVPCCRDYNGVLTLGNVAEQSLQEIWASTEYVEFRKKMVQGTDLSSYCRECMSLYYREG